MTDSRSESSRVGTAARKYQLAIFDSDGTLADTLPWMRSLFNELAATHGFRSVPAEEEARFRALHGRALLRALGLPLWKLPRVVSDMRARMAAATGQFSVFPGIVGALEMLAARGVRLAIVSSNSRTNVESVLRPEGCKLIDHFDCGASMFGKAAKIRRVLKRLGIAAERSIYIGDEVRDGEAARDTGMAFGAVAWGHHSIDQLRELAPAECFFRPEELVEKLC